MIHKKEGLVLIPLAPDTHLRALFPLLTPKVVTVEF